jgi:hypothetical protein
VEGIDVHGVIPEAAGATFNPHRCVNTDMIRHHTATSDSSLKVVRVRLPSCVIGSAPIRLGG